MSDTDQRLRQYAGLAVVIVAFLGGLVGWSWAVLSVEAGPSPPDTTHTRVEPSQASLGPTADETIPDGL